MSEGHEHEEITSAPGEKLTVDNQLFDVLVPEARLCVLSEDIYEGVYSDVVRGLTRLAVASTNDIHLHISSGGGNAFVGLGIADAITSIQEQYHVHILGEVQGCCMSAALLPLMACHQRSMGAHSVLMMHGPSSSMFRADQRSMSAEVALTAKMNLDWAEWFARRTRKPVEFWVQMLTDQTPHYWTAVEALTDGLVDAIQ